MSGRISAATERALALVGTPKPNGELYTPYAAAKIVGIAVKTIYRALKAQAGPLTPAQRLDRLEVHLRKAGVPYKREGAHIIAGRIRKK